MISTSLTRATAAQIPSSATNGYSRPSQAYQAAIIAPTRFINRYHGLCSERHFARLSAKASTSNPTPMVPMIIGDRISSPYVIICCHAPSPRPRRRTESLS